MCHHTKFLYVISAFACAHLITNTGLLKKENQYNVECWPWQSIMCNAGQGFVMRGDGSGHEACTAQGSLYLMCTKFRAG